MAEQYFVLKLKNVPHHLEDLVTSLCFDFAAEGVSEDLQFIQNPGEYEVQSVESDYKSLKVYFSAMPSAELKNKILQLNNRIEYLVNAEENKDWLAEWKKGFKSFQLAGDIWVVPSWLEKPEAKKYLSIDPGMAFGTGTHETTSLAAKALVKLDLNGKSVIDVGTGTAILAMLCHMQGASPVVGTDIDPTARRVAKENVALNKMNEIKILDHQIDQVETKFDLVIANIIDGVLTEIQSDLMRLVKPGGYLLLTGIIKERLGVFEHKFLWERDFTKPEVLEDGEWLGMLAKRDAQ